MYTDTFTFPYVGAHNVGITQPSSPLESFEYIRAAMSAWGWMYRVQENDMVFFRKLGAHRHTATHRNAVLLAAPDG